MPKWYIGFIVVLGGLSLFASTGAAIINPLIAIAGWFVWLFVRNLVRGATIQTATGVAPTSQISNGDAEQRAKFCSECGTPLAATSIYCQACGTRVRR